MNCRPGDIAIVYRTKAPGAASSAPVELLDRIVKAADCLVVAGEIHWNLAAAVQFVAGRNYTSLNRKGQLIRIERGDTARMLRLPDACLRPIRDPGDDAVDEMVAITKTPETVPA